MASLRDLQSLGGLVYSTDHGRMCPACSKPQAQCVCKQIKPVPTGDGIVRVSRETKGRGGKAVTLVKGVLVDSDQLEQLGKQLKTACGTGGTVKDGVIEVQGDHVEKVMAALQKLGYKVKRAGGGRREHSWARPGRVAAPGHAANALWQAQRLCVGRLARQLSQLVCPRRLSEQRAGPFAGADARNRPQRFERAFGAAAAAVAMPQAASRMRGKPGTIMAANQFTTRRVCR